MEEVAAGQAGGIRRPAKASRRRGRRALEEADDDTAPPAAGEGGNRPAAGDSRDGGIGIAAEDEEEEADKYLDRTWVSEMSWCVFLMWAKAQPLIHPPAWLSAAREAGAGEQQLAAASYYESLSVLSFVAEAAIVVHLCLYKLRVVSPGRTLESVMHLMAVGLVASVVATAASAVGAAGGSSENWREAAAAAMLPLMPVASALFSSLLGELKEQVRELFRG